MNRYLLAAILICTLIFPWANFAMETDQYNLPPVPLADIGDEVSEYVEGKLVAAVAKINGEIALHEACLHPASFNKSDCGRAEAERERLTYLRSNDAVAKELFRLLGEGNIFVSPMGKWINSHKFRGEPSRYKADYLESIYIAEPIDYATLSPTVRLFGAEFGTDKLDHLFQQGYNYYTIVNKSVAKGATPDEAAVKAVKWGQKTERTYFGLLVSGVYSNADLYANYAGLKFYQGLTADSEINGKPRPAPVVLKDGLWSVHVEGLRETLLKPYLTDHLNEALNPSAYAFTIFGSVRHAVKKNGCPEWKQLYPEMTAIELTNRSKALELWNGEHYGSTKNKRMVTIAETCFSSNS
jgi:hypothetical protein